MSSKILSYLAQLCKKVGLLEEKEAQYDHEIERQIGKPIDSGKAKARIDRKLHCDKEARIKESPG